MMPTKRAIRHLRSSGPAWACAVCFVGATCRSDVVVSSSVVGPPSGSMGFTLANRTCSASISANAGASVTIAIGLGGDVSIRNLSIDNPGLWVCPIQFPGSTVPTTATDVGARHATPGSGAWRTAALTGGRVVFSSFTVPVLTRGTATYNSIGLACSQIQATGAPCVGNFDFSQSGQQLALVSADLPASGVGPASFIVSFMAPFSATSLSWGNVTLGMSWSAQLAPSCQADFNADTSVTVQDLFDFLAAWFAGDPRADISGGGVGVQDIFDFLTAWFAGC